MIDTDKIKYDLNVDELRKLAKYIDAIIIWKERPDMYLEPKISRDGGSFEYHYTEENEDNQESNQE